MIPQTVPQTVLALRGSYLRSKQLGRCGGKFVPSPVALDAAKAMLSDAAKAMLSEANSIDLP